MNTHSNNTSFADTVARWRHKISLTITISELLGKNVNSFYKHFKEEIITCYRSNVNVKSWHDFQLKTQSSE